MDAWGYLPRGLRLSSKPELVDVLRTWLRDSSASTIGEVGSYGGKRWLVVDIGRYELALNADTTRAAVQVVVRTNERDPNRPWQVVANKRGRVNKVLPGPDGEPLPGWYAYLIQPVTTARTI